MISKVELIDFPAFQLSGITIRTTNQNGQSQKDIGGLWQRFMADGILQKIEGRISDDTYCVYTDYETDHTGFYTTLIGCKVDTVDHIAEGFTGLTIPSGKYQVYTLAGKFPEKVHLAWQEIWDSDANRAYTADFDLYSANAKSFAETEVKIYLAAK
jgi:predicted transcriptional regulator YdeE